MIGLGLGIGIGLGLHFYRNVHVFDAIALEVIFGLKGTIDLCKVKKG